MKNTKISIIYSSIGGNTEIVVKKMVETLQTNTEFELNISRVDTASVEMLESYLTILASPTYGQGSLESHFPPFLKQIRDKIEGKNFAIIGLGDTKYYPEYLTEASQLLEGFVKENKGNLIIPPLRIGTPPLKMLDKLVVRWADKLVQKIQTENE